MATPAAQEIVFCHGCENEWYRDEGGLECPECHSDFTEIIEADHDPREDNAHIPADPHPLADHNPWDAPDPDEEDIDRFQFTRNAPGQEPGGTYRARINRTIEVDGNGRPVNQEQQGGGGGGGFMGMVGNVLQGLIGPAVEQYQQQYQHQRGPGSPTPGEAQQRPNSAPGSPRGQQQGTGFTRHVQGPNYSFTITSSTTAGGNLFPRHAHGPQPFQAQPDQMDDMLRQMIQNIGVFPGLGHPTSQRQGPGGFMFDDGHHHHGPPGMMPFPQNFMDLLAFAGGNGAHGDAVYSQEALDRIVTQLMEQHQTGNAPGPATDAAINSLPTRELTNEDFGDDGKADCSICMEDKSVGEEVTVLPCGHWFDGQCVAAWLKTHDTCPQCRQGIMPRDGDNAGARQATQAPLNNTNIQQAAQPTPSVNTAQQSSGGVFNRMRDAFGRP